MDATFDAAQLASAVAEYLDDRDYEGAEVFLTLALVDAPATPRTFLHLQFAKLYREWNKLTSALDHLHRAVEIEGVDVFLRVQILDELKSLKSRQTAQRP